MGGVGGVGSPLSHSRGGRAHSSVSLLCDFLAFFCLRPSHDSCSAVGAIWHPSIAWLARSNVYRGALGGAHPLSRYVWRVRPPNVLWPSVDNFATPLPVRPPRPGLLW